MQKYVIALYIRLSLEDYKYDSMSIENQHLVLNEFVSSMPESTDAEVLEFIDNGYSGGNVDRDGFQKMMRQIERGKISKVIVYRLDRISRSLSDFVGILETLKKHNVQFVSSQESFDTSSPYGEMIVKILICRRLVIFWYSALTGSLMFRCSMQHVHMERADILFAAL